MNDRFNIRYFNKNTRKFEYYKIGTVNTIPFTDRTVYEQGQFCTGLKDRNGTLIYEGDILKDKYGALHPISWNVKGFYEADTFAVAGFYNAIQEDMEVIGNIYEIKSLLESEG